MFDTKPESDTVKEEFPERGVDVTMRALIGDHIEYFYLDTQDSFGCLIESGSGHAIDFVTPGQVYAPSDTGGHNAGPNEITQVSVVVRDLEAKMKAYRETSAGGLGVRCGRQGVHVRLPHGRKPCDFFDVRWAEVEVEI